LRNQTKLEYHYKKTEAIIWQVMERTK
jgi:hypothetical protein